MVVTTGGFVLLDIHIYAQIIFAFMAGKDPFFFFFFLDVFDILMCLIISSYRPFTLF